MAWDAIAEQEHGFGSRVEARVPDHAVHVVLELVERDQPMPGVNILADGLIDELFPRQAEFDQVGREKRAELQRHGNAQHRAAHRRKAVERVGLERRGGSRSWRRVS